MPELPEVETIRQDLLQKVINKKIIDVEILHKKTVRNNERSFLSILKNNKIKNIKRTGKLIIFELVDGNNFLLVHLKMTGQLIYKKGGQITAGGHSESNTDLNLPNRHTRVIITFADKSKLFFNDMRLFGYMKIEDEQSKDKIVGNFGIEPLTKDFTLPNFEKIFENRRTNIKAILLNQKLIAGLGNIYVDEVCFEADVRPDKSAANLSKEQMKRIYSAIELIIKKAIEKRGTTFNNYIDADGNKGNFLDCLKVYGRGGGNCKKCKNILKKINLAGRGTVFCEKCQK